MEENVFSGFPLDKLSFALQQHLAPRVVRTAGQVSKPIEISQCILVGCRSSKTLTQAYLMRGIKRVDSHYPEANTQLFVDVTSMHTVAETRPEVLDKHVPAMLCM